MTRIGIWTLRLMRGYETDALTMDVENEEVHHSFQDELSEVEAFCNEKLPEGFYVKIDDH